MKNNCLRLIKVMMKNESMESPSIKSRRILVGILGFIAVICIFVPACILVGVISFIMTTAVSAAGGSEQGLALILMFVAGFSVIFGLSVILNVFYFSNDMNYLLPFPLQPWEIIASKFTVAYINESVMEFMVILSAMAGYIIATKVSVINILISLLAMITIPILPLVYCGLISIILMTFTGVVKNKDSVHKIMGIAICILIIAAFVSVSAVGGLNIDNYAQSLADGNNGMYKVLSIPFIHVRLICQAADGNLHALLLYVVVNAAAIAVFLFAAQKLYFKGVVGLGASGRSREMNVERIVSERAVRRKGVRISYLNKEFKMLFRTPAYMMNCVLINLLWPILLYAVSMIQGSESFLIRMYLDYQLGNQKLHVYVPVVVIIISILVTAANSIASSAVTREGKGFEFMKYIPLPIKEQLLMKSLVSIIISQSCLSVYIIAAAVYFNITVINCILYLLLAFTGVVFVTFLGVTLDTVNPKLLWDDEINALRGNSTVFFSMAYAMILGVLLAGLAFMLLEFTKLSVTAINGIILLFMIILDIGAYVNCVNTGQGNLEKL